MKKNVYLSTYVLKKQSETEKLKGRVIDREGEEDVPSPGVSHSGGRVPNTWKICCYFPRHNSNNNMK